MTNYYFAVFENKTLFREFVFPASGKRRGCKTRKKSFLTTYCLFNVFCCKLIHNIMLKMYMYLINYLLGALEMNTALLFSYMQ